MTSSYIILHAYIIYIVYNTDKTVSDIHIYIYMFSVCRRTGGNEFFFLSAYSCCKWCAPQPSLLRVIVSILCRVCRLATVYIGISSRLRSLFPYFHPRRYPIYNHVVPFSLTRFFLPLPPPPIYILYYYLSLLPPLAHGDYNMYI